MNLPLFAAGGLAGFWLVDRALAANERSAAGNLTMTEKLTASWLNDLNTRGLAYRAALLATEDRHGMPRYLLARLAWQESRFRPDIIEGRTVSSAGALGIMQLVPKWHPTMPPSACLDPARAIPYAGNYLASLKKQFGTWELALKAYNWGPGNLAKYLAGAKALPIETARYSAEILADVRALTGSTFA
jgi:soluble lytic murein transglycosylase-like protein